MTTAPNASTVRSVFGEFLADVAGAVVVKEVAPVITPRYVRLTSPLWRSSVFCEMGPPPTEGTSLYPTLRLGNIRQLLIRWVCMYAHPAKGGVPKLRNPYFSLSPLSHRFVTTLTTAVTALPIATSTISQTAGVSWSNILDAIEPSTWIYPGQGRSTQVPTHENGGQAP